MPRIRSITNTSLGAPGVQAFKSTQQEIIKDMRDAINLNLPTSTTIATGTVTATTAVTAPAITGSTSVTTPSIVTDAITEKTALADVTVNSALIEKHATAAINASATATAAQVKTGYITSTSAAPTTITLPTGALLGAALGATRGTVFNLYIDNTAGANNVLVSIGGVAGAFDSDWNTQINGILGFNRYNIASGSSGQAGFTFMFSSATVYTITRTA